MKVWACSLGLQCLTMLFLTWSREHFQENFVIPVVLKALPPAGLPSSGISVTPLAFLSSGPGVFRLGSGLGLMEFLEDNKECVCLFWFCVCLFRCRFSFTISLPAHSWVLHFITSTVVSAGGLVSIRLFVAWQCLVGLTEGSLWISVLASPVPLSWRENVWTWGKKCHVTFVLWLVSNEMLIVLVLFGLIQQRNEVEVQNYSWQLAWHPLGCLNLTWWESHVKLYQKSRLWFEFVSTLGLFMS